MGGGRNLAMAERIEAAPVGEPVRFVVAGDSGAWPDPTADAIFAELVAQVAALDPAPAFFAQLAAMTEAETRTLRDWADRETARNLATGLTDDEAADLAWDDICGVVGLDRSEVAQRIRDRIAANEARRFDADEALRRRGA